MGITFMKKCPKCSEVILPNNNFCINCGFLFEETAINRFEVIKNLNTVKCLNCSQQNDTSNDINLHNQTNNLLNTHYLDMHKKTNESQGNLLNDNSTSVSILTDNRIENTDNNDVVNNAINNLEIDEWHIRRINLNKALNYLKNNLENELKNIEKELLEIKQKLEIAKNVYQQLRNNIQN